jgi:hypothetical protein
MNETELDRMIDTAAAEMIERKPSRTLRHAVMARIREPRRPAPRRLIWAGGAAVAILGGALAIPLIHRAGAPSVADRSAGLPPIFTADAPAVITQVTPPDRQPAPSLETAAPISRSASRRVRGPAFSSDDLASSVEPITADPVVLPSIDLLPLESQAASVEQLEIEALTIEPLTASND